MFEQGNVYHCKRKGTHWKKEILFIAMISGMLALGCASSVLTETLPDNGNSFIQIAQPCETLAAADNESDRKIDSVFIEIVGEIETAFPRPVEDWFLHHKVEAKIVGGFKTYGASPYHFKIDDADSETQDIILIITTTLPDNPLEQVSITVKMIRSGMEDVTIDEKIVATTHQKPVVLELKSENSTDVSPIFVITPYLLAGDESMQKLLLCKTNQ